MLDFGNATLVFGAHGWAALHSMQALSSCLSHKGRMRILLCKSYPHKVLLAAAAASAMAAAVVAAMQAPGDDLVVLTARVVGPAVTGAGQSRRLLRY